MRQLFLPVCLCVVTWSAPTGSNPRMTLDEFSRVSLASRGQIAVGDDIAARHDETASAVVKIPDDVPPAGANAPAPDIAEIAALVPDLAAEFPVPSGVVINSGIPAGIPLPPIAKPVITRSEDEICSALTVAAQQNDVPAPFFIRLLFQESRFRPEVVSHAGAQGIAQFMPETANLMGLDNPYDPLEAIPASARLLGRLVRQFGNLGLAAAAYNAGPRRIADWLAAKGKTKLPDETQGYVKIITGKPVEHWSAASARHPAQKLPEQAPCQEVAGLLAWAGPDEVPLPQRSPLRDGTKIASAHSTDQASVSERKLPEKKPAEKKSADKPGKSGTTAKSEMTGKGATSRHEPGSDAAKSQPAKRERVAQR